MRGRKQKRERGKNTERVADTARERGKKQTSDWQAVACRNWWDVIKAWSKGSVRYSQNLTIWHSLSSSLICAFYDNDTAACSFIHVYVYVWLHFHGFWPEPCYENGLSELWLYFLSVKIILYSSKLLLWSGNIASQRCIYPPNQAMQYMSVKTWLVVWVREGNEHPTLMDQNFTNSTGRRVTQEKSWCRALKSCVSHLSDFTPMFFAPERGTIIGIAGSTDSSCASTQGNGMHRGKREKVSGR